MQRKFKKYEKDLGLTPETENLGCKRMWADFSWGGSSNKMLYFVKGDWGTTICKAVNWETPYPAFERDNYKRCVCKE